MFDLTILLRMVKYKKTQFYITKFRNKLKFSKNETEIKQLKTTIILFCHFFVCCFISMVSLSLSLLNESYVNKNRKKKQEL